jgi:hypothetical protein
MSKHPDNYKVGKQVNEDPNEDQGVGDDEMVDFTEGSDA